MDVVDKNGQSQSNNDVDKKQGRRKKKKKLYKVKRSSGETQLLTKEQIKELNRSKKRKQVTKRYFKLIAFVFGIFITAFGAWLVTGEVINKYKGSPNDEVVEELSDVVTLENRQSRTEFPTEDTSEEKIDSFNKSNSLEAEKDKKVTQNRHQEPKRNEYIPQKTKQENKITKNILSAISPTKVSIIQAPEDTITTSNVNFVFDANKSVKFSYMLEGKDSQYSDFLDVKSKSYSNLPDGSYTFHLRAKDVNGKTTEPIVKTFTIDTTPPNVEIVKGPDGTVSEHNIIFQLNANEDATFATFLQGYDNQFSEYNENTIKSYNKLSDGDYIFQVKAKDKYGNENLTPVIRTFTVDSEAPGVKIIEAPDSIINNKNVTFRFTADEDATFAFWLKGKDSGYSDFVSNDFVTYNQLSDGDYTFFVKAQDKSGNIDPEPAKLEFTIDTTPPETLIKRAPKQQVKYSTVSFSFDADEKALFSYYLEGYNEEYSDYTSESSKTYHNLPDGNYKFFVKSRDLAGNIDEEGVSRDFTIKTKEIIFTEDFEDKETKIEAGTFDEGKVYWGLTNEKAKSGKNSLWCAQVGNKDKNYSKDMNVWYKISVDLSKFNKAELDFWYYLNTTKDITDRFYIKVLNRKDSELERYIEQTKPIWFASVKKEKQLKWNNQRIVLNKFCGQSAIIMFFFQSDDKLEGQGAFLDDISVIGKY